MDHDDKDHPLRVPESRLDKASEKELEKLQRAPDNAGRQATGSIDEKTGKAHQPDK